MPARRIEGLINVSIFGAHGQELVDLFINHTAQPSHQVHAAVERRSRMAGTSREAEKSSSKLQTMRLKFIKGNQHNAEALRMDREPKFVVV